MAPGARCRTRRDAPRHASAWVCAGRAEHTERVCGASKGPRPTLWGLSPPALCRGDPRLAAPPCRAVPRGSGRRSVRSPNSVVAAPPGCRCAPASLSPHPLRPCGTTRGALPPLPAGCGGAVASEGQAPALALRRRLPPPLGAVLRVSDEAGVSQGSPPARSVGQLRGGAVPSPAGAGAAGGRAMGSKEGAARSSLLPSAA